LGADARTCIYCSKLKAAAEFSLEHIIPQFMGGNGACVDIVTRDVCRRCNSIMGRFVDALVARGFFQNAIETGTWRQCIGFNEAAGNIFPLIYLGRSAELTFGSEEEAEVWLGPEGGPIWHIHTRQPEDYASLAGGDPVLARKDAASRVYVFNASAHPYWLFSSFKSARAHFTREPLFLGADSDIEPELSKNRARGKLCQKDSAALAERDKIRSVLDQDRQLRNAVHLDLLFDIRFLTKLALAFGHKLLGSQFGQLEYTHRLRRLLWTRRVDLPSTQPEIRMLSYFAGLHDKSMQILACPLAFVFVVSSLREGLVLSLIFPSGHRSQVSITDPSVDPMASSLTRDVPDRVFVAVPQAAKTIGPIGLLEYTAWKVSQHKIPELDGLMSLICDRSSLPPLR
jgi:hypothetical protein